MSVKIWDAQAQAFKDAETPKIWNAENRAWKDSTGLIQDAENQAWKEVWTPFPDKVYLYNHGDECVDVTGGWKGATVLVEGNGFNSDYYKNNDHLMLRSYSYDFYSIFFTGQQLNSNDPPIYVPKGYKVGIVADWKISFYEENYSINKPNTGLFEFGFVQTASGGIYESNQKWLLKNQSNIWANIGDYHTTVSAYFGPSVLYTAPSTEDMNGYFRFNVRYSSKRSTRDTDIYLKVYEVWIEKVN